jgi:hypothetical protein
MQHTRRRTGELYLAIRVKKNTDINHMRGNGNLLTQGLAERSRATIKLCLTVSHTVMWYQQFRVRLSTEKQSLPWPVLSQTTLFTTAFEGLDFIHCLKKAKAVPLHATKALGGR